MKKYLLLSLCFFSIAALAQTEEQAQEDLRRSEKTKSGNYKDVLTGFYQVALKSISPTGKDLEFNSTLFSIFKNYDDNVLITKNRSGIAFLRNFQISGKINLNSDFEVRGYSAGVTYSPINKRDKSFVNFTGSPFHLFTNQFEILVSNAINPVIGTLFPHP